MAVLLLSLMHSGFALADIYIVANGNIDLNANEIADVYLGKKLLVTSVKLVPVDNASIQNEFLEKALKMDLATYREIWMKKGLSDGLNPPEIRHNDVAVLAYLRKTPGAVGYISELPPSLAGLTVIKKYQ